MEFAHIPRSKIKEIIDNKNKHELYDLIRYIATYLSGCIKNENLHLRPIRYYHCIDGMSKKERVIGVQEPIHQIFDYIAINGLEPMLKAKIGVFQCASLPNKGQSYGKKYVERWVREKDTVYYVKGDIKKCFPSIPLDRLKQLLARDVKNDKLLWLVYQLLDMFETGLSIGSYLSQYLCNYYLSYAYHYASEKLFKIRKTRKGDKQVRLINHVLFYMDDFLLTGNNKKYLRKGMKMLIKYLNDFLGLEVKPKWKVSRVDCEPIDMMGFVFYPDRTIIRAKIFLKARRTFKKAEKYIKNKHPIPAKLAYQCVSAYGWFKNTDSRHIRDKLNIDMIVTKSKRTISCYTKKKGANKNATITKL